MRELGKIEREWDARRFAAYLSTLEISTQVSEEDGEWVLWVREEDRLTDAQYELSLFQATPNDPKYDIARPSPATVHEASQQSAEAEEPEIDPAAEILLADTRPPYERFPLAFALIVATVLITWATDFGRDSTWMRRLAFADETQVHEGQHYLVNVRAGQIWRVLTPVFIQQNGMTLLFTILLLYWFGGQFEQLKGTLRFALAFLIIAIVSNLFQAASPYEVGGGHKFGGLWGVAYGMFALVWVNSRSAPESGFMISRMVILFLLLMMLSFPLMNEPTWFAHQGTTHVARLSGFASGLALAFSPVLLKRA